MSEIERATVFGKLNSVAYKSLDAATTFCKLRGNPYVELVHWVHQIVQLPDSDLGLIIARFQIDPSRLARDLTESLDRLPRGASSISDFSAHIDESIERAWVYSTLLFGDARIRTGYLVVGILKSPTLRHAFLGMSREFAKITADTLSDEFGQICSGSPEDADRATDATLQVSASPGEASGAMAPAQMGKQEALRRFTVDLTERARQGQLDPIVGRDDEIRQIVDILMRRRQNNPILTGEAGVGKTAVVEGFALRIAAGDTPPPLRRVALRTLDVGLLQAGASMKGEFEARLRQLIEEVQSSPQPIILFIDEAHTLIGAGGAAGTGDAANLLKPALARGTLRTIAATTWAEYKKYFEKDPALTRRFQVIQVDEPSEEKALLMMRAVTTTLEKHHRVQILDEALEAAVKLSHRYIPARQLPDKSVSLLDTSCARVAISQHSIPAEVEDARRTIEALEVEKGIIGRERAIGVDVDKRATTVESKLQFERKRLLELEQRWQSEKDVVDRILELRARLRGSIQPVETTASDLEASARDVARDTSVETAPRPAADPPLSDGQRQDLLIELRRHQSDLTALQGDAPLILPSVDEQAVAAVVADWTGIPVGRMVKDEIGAVLKLANTLEQRVIGQQHALDTIAERVQVSRAKLDNPNKPIGVFLLCGPSGVGKTETALALAEALYGGEHSLITINMSEFQEAHTVSTLKGAPPGYVGYGEGGVLTEAVRRKPYSVVLLDEIEKAHPDVHEIFFQVFDKGMMEDGEGRLIDFKNTMILLTSNVGTELIMNMCKDPELMPEPDGISKALREPLLKQFPAALLGRLVVVPYYPLSDAILQKIIRLQLDRIVKRVAQNHDLPLTYDEGVVDLIARRCTEVESGARTVDTILTNTVLPAISAEFLNRMLSGTRIERVRIGCVDDAFEYMFD